jgi:glycosyltransferase involved in cell wall biosynthesis
MKVFANIQLRPSSDGGIETPLYSDYRATIKINDIESRCIINILNKDYINPGQWGNAEIIILDKIGSISKTDSFTLYELGHEIGKGYLTHVLNKSIDDKPRVSVAVPCYKFAKYIEKAINSIQSQITNFDFEIVIADDYSMDGTYEIIHKLAKEDKRIRILNSDKNLGIYRNIKRLIESCKGDYIAYIDGDDYFIDNYKLQKQFDFLENNKEYSMHSTSCKWIDEFGQETDKSIIPLFSDVTIEMILNSNYITFGRMFKNVENIVPDWAENIIFLDWIINFQILKHGKARCEDICTGVYRTNSGGVITSLDEDRIQFLNREVRELINIKYKNYKEIKPIAIIDCYVHDGHIEKKLVNAIDKIKKDGIPVLLISNTPVNWEIIKSVDYYLYDSENRLFSIGQFTSIRGIDIWKANEHFESHLVSEGLQRHGLSVLCNLFNALNYLKYLGYTHFFRFEADDIFGPESREFIKSVPDYVEQQGKKGLFYFNEDSGEPNDVSFHFMYCDIDFFSNSVTRISNENDYKKYLIETNNNLDFKIVEEFLYDNLLKIGKDNFVCKRGTVDMDIDFPDTIWNTVVSNNNSSSEIGGCQTFIYQKNREEGEFTVLSWNNTTEYIKSEIELIFKDGHTEKIWHEMPFYNSWTYANYQDLDYIKVYKNGNLISTQETNGLKNYIIFK